MHLKNKTMIGLLIASVALSGCASVTKKFIRKPKEVPHKASMIYLEEGPYQKKYSNDYYYKTHYTFWQTWHDELVRNLGANSKKTARCAQESLSQLNQMKNYLDSTKQKELEVIIGEFSGVAGKLASGDIAKQDQSGLRTELEKIRRLVANNFYYEKVKNNMLGQVVDLGAEEAKAAAPAVSGNTDAAATAATPK